MNPSLTDKELLRTFRELGFVTVSYSLIPILRDAYKAAVVSDITVLLEGETGTGKQVLANAIHELDEKRRPHPFVTAHCGTINDSVAETELFGHSRGAFTGAVASRKGLFQSAHLGTIFLDDLSDLPLQLQSKLLDVIQRGIVRPLGSDEEKTIDVRIVAASNQPLGSLVTQHRFRSDLYHRLDVVKLTLPPLRERMEDLPQLLLFLAYRHRKLYQPIEKIEPDLLQYLQSLAFPGNIRQLENAVQRMLFAKTQGISFGLGDWSILRDVDFEEGSDPLNDAAIGLWKAISLRRIPYAQAIWQVERKLLQTAVRSTVQTHKQLAEKLQANERTLYHKMRSHHVAA